MPEVPPAEPAAESVHEGRGGPRRFPAAATAATLAAAALVAAVVLFASTLPSHAELRAREPVPPPLRVRATPCGERVAYSARRSFLGRVEARRSSALGFELGGQVAELRFDEGERVERGAVLGRLDTARLEARGAELEALVDQERAALETARTTLERYRAAIETRAVSEQQLDVATRDLAVREAALARARAAVERVRVDLEKATLHAPYTALVTRRSVDEGEVVGAGAVVFELAEVASPEARVGVAGRAADTLAPGMELEVRVEGRPFAATLRAIGPRRNRTTRGLEALFQLEAELGRDVRAGDLAEIELAVETGERGRWVPLVGLTESARGLWAVLVAEEAGPGDPPLRHPEATHRLGRRQVEMLATTADRAFVRGTLRKGDLVVTGGLHELAPGMEVAVAVDERRDAEAPR